MALLPSTPRNAVIGQMVTISYTVATSFEQLVLVHFMNTFEIPNPVPSPDNEQLLQYSFVANSSNGGTYRLSLSKFVCLCQATITCMDWAMAFCTYILDVHSQGTDMELECILGHPFL